MRPVPRHPNWRSLASRRLLLALFLTGPAVLPAQEAPRLFETRAEADIGGERVRYRAIVEETFLTDEAGKPTASLVSISYVRTNLRRDDARPVVFVFNGGPGSSSVWLHMGLVGPRRIAFGNDVEPETVPPFGIADNPDSILDVADVVLFDPPGTGYSRVLPDGKPEQFFGVTQDATATVRFVEDWLNRYGRWQSPRYLMGESYGTVRAAVVAKLLAGGPMTTGSMEGITLNGIVLLGQAMGHGVGELAHANDLPSLAATAWYHGKVERQGRTLEQHVAEARKFAAAEYVQALYAGSRLGEAGRRRLAERLAALTGLSANHWLENDLRVSRADFSRALLAGEGKQVGVYDSRYVLPLASSGNDPVADDPAMGQYVPGFVAALNSYLRDELGVPVEDTYRAIDFRKVNGRWDYGYGPGVPPSRSFAPDLGIAMRRNPELRLFFGNGYYDLATTMGAAEYVIAHSDFPPDRITVVNYESGHMPYLGEGSRRQLAVDLRRFIEGTSTGNEQE